MYMYRVNLLIEQFVYVDCGLEKIRAHKASDIHVATYTKSEILDHTARL